MIVLDCLNGDTLLRFCYQSGMLFHYAAILQSRVLAVLRRTTWHECRSYLACLNKVCMALAVEALDKDTEFHGSQPQSHSEACQCSSHPRTPSCPNSKKGNASAVLARG